MLSSKSVLLLLLLSVIAALAACGQPGELYLPDDKKSDRAGTGDAGQH